MSFARSIDKDTAIVLSLLILCPLSVFVGIDYSYSAHARTAYPGRKERMHLRGFLYTLLVCLGILLVVVIYLLTTRHTRLLCRRYASAMDSVPTAEISGATSSVM